MNRRGFLAFLGAVPLAPLIEQKTGFWRKVLGSIAPSGWGNSSAFAEYPPYPRGGWSYPKIISPSRIDRYASAPSVTAGDFVFFNPKTKRTEPCEEGDGRVLGVAISNTDVNVFGFEAEVS